ncbi:MAG: alanine racemase [Acidimicrobiales bacterium]
MGDGTVRPAWAEIDLGALSRNTEKLVALVSPAALCAVVKADGYGHGAVRCASAALAGGAAGLAVALVEEGIELREAGITAPVLVLSEPPYDALDTAVAGGLTPTLYSEGGVVRTAAAARALGRRVPVHLKVDTGMHRVGADPSEVGDLARAVSAEPMLTLEGVWTHLAVADGSASKDAEFTELQLDRLGDAVSALEQSGATPALVHAANSAAAIAYPASRMDMVRCGITLYGELPGDARVIELPESIGTLEPVMSLHAKVASVRELRAGDRVSYGLLRPLPTDAFVATIPIGYADGVPRKLFEAGFQVLIGGRRYPIAGTITMDQLMVDCGGGPPPTPGDDVVLLGRQLDEEITAREWADLLGTISYEILCGIGRRVPRVYLGGPGPDRDVTTAPPIAQDRLFRWN